MMPNVGDRVRGASTTVNRATQSAWSGVVERASHMRSTGEESTKALIGKVRRSSSKEVPASVKATKASKASTPAKKVAKKPTP